MLMIYLGHLLLTGKSLDYIMKVRSALTAEFEMSDCGPLKFFLGIKMNNSMSQVKSSQESSIDKVFLRFGMSDCNAAGTPMVKGLKLELKVSMDGIRKSYRELLDSLMYNMLCVRPDLCFDVGYIG